MYTAVYGEFTVKIRLSVITDPRDGDLNRTGCLGQRSVDLKAFSGPDRDIYRKAYVLVGKYGTNTVLYTVVCGSVTAKNTVIGNHRLDSSSSENAHSEEHQGPGASIHSKECHGADGCVIPEERIYPKACTRLEAHDPQRYEQYIVFFIFFIDSFLFTIKENSYESLLTEQMVHIYQYVSI
jgi:hypothetical protein